MACNWKYSSSNYDCIPWGSTCYKYTTSLEFNIVDTCISSYVLCNASSPLVVGLLLLPITRTHLRILWQLHVVAGRDSRIAHHSSEGELRFHLRDLHVNSAIQHIAC